MVLCHLHTADIGPFHMWEFLTVSNVAITVKNLQINTTFTFDYLQCHKLFTLFLPFPLPSSPSLSPMPVQHLISIVPSAHLTGVILIQLFMSISKMLYESIYKH